MPTRIITDVDFINGPPLNMRFSPQIHRENAHQNNHRRRLHKWTSSEYAVFTAVMDELGFLHYPLRGIRGGALFPIRHEPSGNYRRACRASPRASLYKGSQPVERYTHSKR